MNAKEHQKALKFHLMHFPFKLSVDKVCAQLGDALSVMYCSLAIQIYGLSR